MAGASVKNINLSAIFIRRPVATSLLALAILISGILAFLHMPVAPLPNVEFPVVGDLGKSCFPKTVHTTHAP